MMGTKKPRTIRQEIEEAFASTRDDPILRLERVIALTKRNGDSADVMEDQKRFLESPRQRKHHERRAEPRT